MTDETIVGFNYKDIDTKTRRSVKKHADTIHQLLERTAEAVAEIGRRLIEVRASMDGTQFQAWLNAEFRWSQSVASNYMRVAEQFGDLDCLKNFQPSALYKLSRSNIQAGVVDTMIERAEAGETITHKIVADAIGQGRQTEVIPAALVNGDDDDELVDVIEDAEVPPVPAQQLRFDFDDIRKQVQQFTATLAADEVEHLADELVELANEIKSSVAIPKPTKPKASPRRATTKRKPAARRSRTQAAELV